MAKQNSDIVFDILSQRESDLEAELLRVRAAIDAYRRISTPARSSTAKQTRSAAKKTKKVLAASGKLTVFARIAATIDRAGRALKTSEILKTVKGTTPATIRNTLAQSAKKRTLVNVSRGLWATPALAKGAKTSKPTRPKASKPSGKKQKTAKKRKKKAQKKNKAPSKQPTPATPAVSTTMQVTPAE